MLPCSCAANFEIINRGGGFDMWNIVVRLGMVLSTVLVGKQVVDHFWPTTINPTALYNPNQIARYLGTTAQEVLKMIEGGDLRAQWIGSRPRITGQSVLDFLQRATA